MRCSVLQRVLQRVMQRVFAVCCKTQGAVAERFLKAMILSMVCSQALQHWVHVTLQRVAACYSVLQRVAACCSVLQCVFSEIPYLLRCVFGAHLDVGLAERQTPCGFIETVQRLLPSFQGGWPSLIRRNRFCCRVYWVAVRITRCSTDCKAPMCSHRCAVYAVLLQCCCSVVAVV